MKCTVTIWKCVCQKMVLMKHELCTIYTTCDDIFIFRFLRKEGMWDENPKTSLYHDQYEVLPGASTSQEPEDAQ